MPTQTFPSFDAYSAAVQQASVRAIFLGPQRTNWALSYLTMNKLSVQWGQDGGANIFQGSVDPGGVMLFMATQNPHAGRGNGRQFDASSLMLLTPGDEFCIAATGWNRWFSVFVPNELLIDLNMTSPVSVGLSCSFIRLASIRAERFQSVMVRLGSMVQRIPATFDSPAALKTTERKLAETVREALGGDRELTQPPGRHAVPRNQIVRMAMNCVDEHPDEYLLVGDLATAAGVSERTLRTAFREYFGVGPQRYLRRRILEQTRQALKGADPSVTTVAEIATRFGVWEFGRFAQDYRLLYGELPSETLHHPH
jgi:AraC family ethanolamine operon transcriptional activator